MSTKLSIAMISLILSGSAWAEGFYVGGGAILTQIEEDSSGFDFDDNAFGWRVLGGYEINENFAVEASYFDAGQAEDSILGTDIEVEFDGFTVSGLGMLPLNDAWTVFGKLGYYDADAKVSALGSSASDSDSGFTLGGGVRFDLNDNLSLRGDFDWFDTDLDAVWAVGATLEYHFAM